jgi:hypothetical protein
MRERKARTVFIIYPQQISKDLLRPLRRPMKTGIRHHRVYADVKNKQYNENAPLTRNCAQWESSCRPRLT